MGVLERLPMMPDWPERMTSDVACLFMCMSESAFLLKHKALSFKDGGKTYWAREVLKQHVAKQAGIETQSKGWAV